MIVTATRIPRPNLEQPAPVSTLTAAAIENAGTTSLGDILAQLPAMTSAGVVRAKADVGANVGGLSFADLRGLGVSRTLTLVNGKRHVSGDAGRAVVDLGAIPTALVDRVEVVTGGASAIYGSDAVSGVVNVILRDRFVGYEVGAQGGGPMNGDYGQNYSAYALGGWNFARERGNVVLTVFGDKQERVLGRNVAGLADWGTVANPLSQSSSDGVPDRIFKPYVQTEYFSANGNLVGGDSFNAISGFDAAGNPVPIPARTGTNSFYYGSHAAPCSVCESNELGATPTPRQGRYGAEVMATYDITPKLKVHADLKAVDVKLIDTSGPSFTIFDRLLQPDNAFITPAVQAVMDAHPEEEGQFYVNRSNHDIGGENDLTRRRTLRGVVSVEGEADARFADLSWEASYEYGRTRNSFHSVGGLIPGNFFAAIDAVRDPATGAIRCRKDVPSAWYAGYEAPDPASLTDEACTPFNLFGQQNSRAAIDYVTFEADRTHTITQQVATLTFNFDSSRFFNLPGGPVAVAGGLEYRKEESRNINDPLVLSGITEFAPQPNAIGGFDVREAFLEFDAPLLRDAPFAYRLSLNAAARLANYSHAGDTTAYKVGGVWAPVRGLSLRGTYSRAVRAPNITEAFEPASSYWDYIVDPCASANIDLKSNRAANCAALGVDSSGAIDTWAQGVSSGNRAVKPETAKTWTAGFVLQPSWTPGLALTVDYYDIVIKDAIDSLAPQDAAEKCVDGTGLAQKYCALITRDPATGQIVSFLSTYLNQAALKTAGYDIQLSYTHDVGDWTAAWGRLSWFDGQVTGSFDANYIEKLRQYPFQDYPDVVDRQEGELGNPRWSFITALTYDQGPVSVTWNSQFTSKVRRDKNVPLERYDRPYVEAVWYHDFIVRYRLDAGRTRSELYAGVNNAFDKHIPLGVTGWTRTTASYDIYGRFLFAGYKGRF